MDIDAIINSSPDTAIRGIAERIKGRRLERNLTQKAFSKRVGMGYDAYRRFENTGEITLDRYLKSKEIDPAILTILQRLALVGSMGREANDNYLTV